MRAVLLAETALADTDRLFADGVAHLARKLGRVKPLDAAAVPHARASALAYPADAFAVITHHLGLARHLAAVRIDGSPRAPLALSAELGVEAVATVAVTAD